MQSADLSVENCCFVYRGGFKAMHPFTTNDILIKDGYPVLKEDGLHVAVYVTFPNTFSYPFVPGRDLLHDLKDQTSIIQQHADVTIAGMEILIINDTGSDNMTRKAKFTVIGVAIGLLATPTVIALTIFM